ncbi:hypothetical protein H6F96_09965 [Microcoleus sp. FACHB-53]|nr:hypothetical protein [Microcoleus sp. FACHB-53]
MSQHFQLQPPPDNLRTPLVKLKDHYVQQIEEYLQKLSLAKDKLAHVEALLEGWSSVEELPHQNPRSQFPTASSTAIPENVESEVGDVRDFESSLMGGKGNASGAVKENAVPPHQENGASSRTAIEEPFFPTLLERFIDTLDTSTRTLLSFCVDSRGIELTDTIGGGKTLSLECPNDAVFRRLKSKLPRLVFKWNQFVSSNSIVVISMAKNPFDHKGLSWSKEDLAQLSSKVDKVVEVNGVAYTQLTNNDRSWLAIVPQSVLTPKESDEKQFLMPPQPPTTTNTLVNGERNLISSIDGVQHVEMLPPYQGMERMEALSLLLTEHSGTVLHLGFIVHSLYGELEPSLFKVIKTRVTSSLTQGVEQNLWARVTDEPGCYTLDLKLIEPE